MGFGIRLKHHWKIWKLTEKSKNSRGAAEWVFCPNFLAPFQETFPYRNPFNNFEKSRPSLNLVSTRSSVCQWVRTQAKAVVYRMYFDCYFTDILREDMRFLLSPKGWHHWHHFHQRHHWHVWCHIVMFGIAGSATRPVGTIETTSLTAGLAKPSGWLRLSLKIYNELIWNVKTWSGRNDDDEAKWCWLGEM